MLLNQYLSSLSYENWNESLETYLVTRERVFSHVLQNEQQFLSRITKVHFHYIMPTGMSNMALNVNYLAEQRKDQALPSGSKSGLLLS
jgi:hypothetical protein